MQNAPHLRLVKSFSDESYPYPLKLPLADPLDVPDRASHKNALQQAIRLAGVKDYTLSEDFDALRVKLRTEKDRENIEIALRAGTGPYTHIQELPDGHIDPYYVQDDCETLQIIADEETDLAGKINVIFDSAAKRVIIAAADVGTYFAFQKFAAKVPTLIAV